MKVKYGNVKYYKSVILDLCGNIKNNNFYDRQNRTEKDMGFVCR